MNKIKKQRLQAPYMGTIRVLTLWHKVVLLLKMEHNPCRIREGKLVLNNLIVN